jgi:O-succinylhomoserine sulfhydrylase
MQEVAMSDFNKVLKILKKPGFDTLAIHSWKFPGYKSDPYHSHVMPLYLNNSFGLQDEQEIFAEKVFKGDTTFDGYARISHPNCRGLEELMCSLDGGGGAQTFATGMSAFVIPILCLLKPGDGILVGLDAYGGTQDACRRIFSKVGIKPYFIHAREQYDLEAYLKAHSTKDYPIKAFLCEPITNPHIDCWDLEHCYTTLNNFDEHILKFADNTFPTSYLCRAFEFGADAIVNSLTKSLGAGRFMGGIFIVRDINLLSKISDYYLYGARMDPFTAWFMQAWTETLGLRMERHCDNAFRLARYLCSCPEVSAVSYLGLNDHPHHSVANRILRTLDGRTLYGNMLLLRMKAKKEKFEAFLHQLGNFFEHMVSLLVSDTIFTIPDVTTHSNVKRTSFYKLEDNSEEEFSIRLSVGLENYEDIQDYFDYCFKKVF